MVLEKYKLFSAGGLVGVKCNFHAPRRLSLLIGLPPHVSLHALHVELVCPHVFHSMLYMTISKVLSGYARNQTVALRQIYGTSTM